MRVLRNLNTQEVFLKKARSSQVAEAVAFSNRPNLPTKHILKI